jgi:tartrate dehydrogenase/decarboxylase / D-malate dehydrogenase
MALKIAVIEGDGIGKEVVPEGVRVVESAARRFGLDLAWEPLDWGCDHHARFGRMMPEKGLERIADCDAIFLGAIGWPTVSDVESLWTLLMPIRRGFQQYVNLRPVRLFGGVPSPLANPGPIDLCVVRENNEGEYSEIGGRMFVGADQEMVVQETILTRHGCDRVMRYAFELARKRRRKVTSATKSNGIIHTMPYWDERFRAVSGQFPDVATEQYHIDILTAHFVGRPASFDVVVASNLFGDILSDLGPAVTGTIGIAPSANLNPERRFPSMFEPVHGSAPDIAGRNIANPIGQIWSGALMLEHLGAREAAEAIIGAIEKVLASGENLTRDMGGTASTTSLGMAIADAVSAHAKRGAEAYG